MSALKDKLQALFKKPDPLPERTRLSHFFNEAECKELFDALNNYELVLTSKQMDWADDLCYRWDHHGMKAYCSANDKAFIISLQEYRKRDTSKLSDDQL